MQGKQRNYVGLHSRYTSRRLGFKPSGEARKGLIAVQQHNRP